MPGKKSQSAHHVGAMKRSPLRLRQRSASERPSVNGAGAAARVQLLESVRMVPVEALRPDPDNPRIHPQSQIALLVKNIRANGFTSPLLVDENLGILAGHGRLEAAGRLGMSEVPCVTISGLTEAQKRSVRIADNRLTERSDWDFDLLRKNLRELVELDFDIEATAFTSGEVDILLDGKPQADRSSDIDDEVPPNVLRGAPVTIAGDLWNLGRHRILCGDALERESYVRLMERDRAEMVVTDPPYNVEIRQVRGRGRIRHREFAMASGEMTEPAFGNFLEMAMERAIAASKNGSIHYWFIDWRHLHSVEKAGHRLYGEQKNLLVWNKANAGQGAFYRSKHELIVVFKNGSAPHINNMGMGDTGRYRSNVLDYPGVNALIAARKEEMDAHPTVKPVALIADLMRDCSRRNGIILDPFAGSGTVLLAAERTGRVAYAMEIEPSYIDLAIRRWERSTGGTALHSSGKSFAELLAERQELVPDTLQRRKRA